VSPLALATAERGAGIGSTVADNYTSDEVRMIVHGTYAYMADAATLPSAPLHSAIAAGMAAGAAGVAALNAVTYIDMAVRGRPPSDAPQKTVEVSARKVGIGIPGDGEQKENRLQGLGPLAGIATGVTVGIATALLRRARPRMALLPSSLLGAAAAMAGADGPMALLGVSNPGERSAGAWLADILPHLSYGAVTAAVLRLTD
jgi:hypothetical protein